MIGVLRLCVLHLHNCQSLVIIIDIHQEDGKGLVGGETSI